MKTPNSPDVAERSGAPNSDSVQRWVRSAREIYNETRRNRRYVKSLRKIGASNFEIAKALGIEETDPVLMEHS